MHTPPHTETGSEARWRLPRRDYVVLPLLVLCTCLAMFGVAEVVSRIAFVQSEHDACMTADAQLGTRFRANCESRVKAAEGPWVTNHYNDCGYRTQDSCGPKSAGSVRVAVLGSSVAQGYLVPYRETVAARSEQQLSRYCKRPVEFQNLASIGYVWQRLAARVDDALALHPDVAVIVIVPFDLQQSQAPPGAAPQPQDDDGPMKRLDSLVNNSRAVVAAQHFLFLNPEVYVQLYLRYGDRADFLRPPFGPLWQQRLDAFDHMLAGIADKFRAAHVPLVLIYVPQRAQATLLAGQHAPPGVEPGAFNKKIGEIAQRHGVLYLDTSATFGSIPAAADLYYPVDGHLTGQGDAVVARDLVATLEHQVPPFQDCMVANRSAAAQ